MLAVKQNRDSLCNDLLNEACDLTYSGCVAATAAAMESPTPPARVAHTFANGDVM